MRPNPHLVQPPVPDTPRLREAREALQTCYGKQESIAAIREYLAALAEARARPGRGADAAVAERLCCECQTRPATTDDGLCRSCHIAETREQAALLLDVPPEKENSR
uniref:Uncharacterized protein n=2 Tax=unclassified Mycobacterium TaxID=2642494 RepID=A1UJS1_MYCSK